MAPFVDFSIDIERLGAAGVLRDNHLGAAARQIGDESIRIKCLVGDETAEYDAFDQWCHAHRIVSLPWQKNKADEIAQCVGEREDFGCQAAARLADGLALSPPFAP